MSEKTPGPRLRRHWFSQRGRRLYLGNLVALALLMNVSISGMAWVPPAPPATGTPTPTPTLVKPGIHGLLNTVGANIPNGYRASLAGYVVSDAGIDGMVTWAELQPTADGPIAANNVIDQAIADVDAWNRANPSHHEVLKLRVAAGIRSPQWVMNVSGACVSMTDPFSGHTGCVPRFWTGAVQSKWYAFVQKLAAKYDAAPEIAEVVMTPNMTFYTEPMLRQISDKTDVMALLAAGYSTAVDQQNQLNDIAKIRGYWPRTTVGYTFNPYQVINSNGSVAEDVTFTDHAVDVARQAGLALENDSLRQVYLSGNGSYETMYAQIQKDGKPIAFQTAAQLSVVGNLTTVIQGAGKWGASSIELPPSGYDTVLTPAQVASLGGALPLP